MYRKNGVEGLPHFLALQLHPAYSTQISGFITGRLPRRRSFPHFPIARGGQGWQSVKQITQTSLFDGLPRFFLRGVL
jgi:hypothetical protein